MSAVFDRCLAAQADGRPDDAALIDDGVAVSYRQLDERTTELADRLTAAGVRLRRSGACSSPTTRSDT